MQSRLAVDRRDFAEVIPKHVCVVDALIKGDRAGVLHVAPRSDDDAIGTSDGRLDHQARLADGTVVDEGTYEAIDRVAPEVLGHGQDAVAPRRFGEEDVAGAGRDGEGLLAEDVEVLLEAGEDGAVVRPGIGSDIDGLHIGHGRLHLGDGCEGAHFDAVEVVCL